MTRASLQPPTKLTLHLPKDVRERLDAHLWSEVEKRVPQGAYQRLFVELLEEYFNNLPGHFRV